LRERCDAGQLEAGIRQWGELLGANPRSHDLVLAVFAFDEPTVSRVAHPASELACYDEVGGYVQEYFDRHAEAWLEQAYQAGAAPAAYPIGEERIRLALSGVADAVGPGGSLVDLGCGGGQLLAHAAALGMDAVGVDVAPGMIEAAERLRASLPPADAERISLILGGYEQLEPPTDGFDAVTALGLLEYLPDDDAFLRHATELLRPGGRLAVSCRNRLYNLQSANDYTAQELAEGSAAALHHELAELLATTRPDSLRALARELAACADELAAAADADEREQPPELLHHPSRFHEPRRQHTPRELEQAATQAGLRPVELLALHPHPLPPILESLSPRFYNRLALAWQRALADSPAGIVSSSAYVAVLERPG
jgi:2-polyprenyl-3-methyl-5-hydroxy-6-metoxy-1,4-benzoquinol methylase